MKKTNKIADIALIFMLIGMFLCPSVSYSSGVSHLRIPLKLNQSKEAVVLPQLDSIGDGKFSYIVKSYLNPIKQFLSGIDKDQVTQESIYYLNSNDKESLKYALKASVDIREFLEKSHNLHGGEVLGPAWNSAWHLAARLGGVFKEGSVTKSDLGIIREYFEVVESCTLKWILKREVDSIVGLLDKWSGRRKKPVFTVWVVCEENRERSPIVADEIRKQIYFSMKNLYDYIKVYSYGIQKPVKKDSNIIDSTDEFISGAGTELLKKHTPEQIPKDKIDEVDLILVMEEEQKERLKRIMPASGNKIGMVMEGRNLRISYAGKLTYENFKKEIQGSIDIILFSIISNFKEKMLSRLAEDSRPLYLKSRAADSRL